MRESTPPSPDTATRIIDLGAWEVEQRREQLGSKEKYWVVFEEDGEREEWLFKGSKVFESTGQVSGDHWSEHLASRLMRLGGVPAHHTRLARDRRGGWGVLCRNVLPTPTEQLVHGVELLMKRAAVHDREYRADMNYPAGYQVGRAFRTIRERCGAEGAEHFVGILVMDAWLRNTDRHDENWGIIRSSTGGQRLSPAYDNASCLGRSLQPERMAAYLAGERHGIGGFLGKKGGHSAFTDPDSGRRIPHEKVLAQLVDECGCREMLKRRLDIIDGLRERRDTEVEAVLSAVGGGETEIRFVLRLLDLSLERIRRCIA